ncbi:MAG: Brp/Blh family beta-carotene 15,15'-dioxygenase [Actinomycetota bacterium]|nr:Brp/Blh family beta-carotene 15,15'-dioxygenase [Thermoleophilia bacterium]MDA3005090.1 Brp/Blh family beta-carotene 15,15'-dioxygenase [Actinomycetota bacterium]
MTSLHRRWAVPTYGALVATAALAVAAPGLAEQLQWVPLLLSLLLFGMAHGAVDHRVPGRLLRRALTRREYGALITAYALASITLMALWWVAPVLALVLFLVVAMLHWGDGDLWFCERVNGRSAPRSGASLVAFVLARGLLPIGLPILAHPDTVLPVFDDIVGLFGYEAPLVLSTPQRVAGLCVVGAVVVAAAIFSIRDNRGLAVRATTIDIGEMALLTAFFLVTQPVFAVGVYFLAWHSPRHILRLMMSDPRQRALVDSGRGGAALITFHREALLFTVIPLLGIAAIAVMLAVTGASEIAAISLAAIAALTYPHAVTVAWMDRRQGVWRAPQSDPPDRVTTTGQGG